MATKLYLNNKINDLSGIFPSSTQGTVSPTYIASGGTTLKKMTVSIGSGQTSHSATSTATTATQNGLMAMFVSQPMDGAQTVGGGTLTFNWADDESNTFMNIGGLYQFAYVWRPSTGQKVGNVCNFSNFGGTEPSSANSEQVGTCSGTSAAIIASDGDVIVCEIWFIHQQGMASSYISHFYFDGTTENTTENVIVSNHASFIQFTETLIFKPPHKVYLIQ
jgi:hypothetical protein